LPGSMPITCRSAALVSGVVCLPAFDTIRPGGPTRTSADVSVLRLAVFSQSNCSPPGISSLRCVRAPSRVGPGRTLLGCAHRLAAHGRARVARPRPTVSSCLAPLTTQRNLPPTAPAPLSSSQHIGLVVADVRVPH
jgi:hypothetical protein